MFADDTTLYESGGNLDNLIGQFEKGIEPLIEWCELNKLDINWSKTFFMIITNKHIKSRLPKEININGTPVKIVESFKLLGITLDNKLNFSNYCADIQSSINC